MCFFIIFSYSCIMYYPNLLQSLPSFVSAKIRAEGRSIINNFRKKYISLGEKNELVCQLYTKIQYVCKKNQQLCKLYTSIKTTLPAAYPDTQIPLIQYTCNFAEKLNTVCLQIKTNKFANKPKSEYLYNTNNLTRCARRYNMPSLQNNTNIASCTRRYNMPTIRYKQFYKHISTPRTITPTILYEQYCQL